MTVTDDRSVADDLARARAEARLDAAIARRNTTWAHFEAASELLSAAHDRGIPDLTPYRRNYNEAQADWEHAVRDLTRERVAFQMAHKHWTGR